MTITLDQIHRLAGHDNPAISAPIVAEFARQLPPSNINNALRRQHFLAQVCYESAYFNRLVEVLNYTADRIPEVWKRLKPRAAELAHNGVALANAAYANINGNGNEASGDGWMFRGRGLIMLTGRGNYRQFGFEHDPDQVAEPPGAVNAAIAFWDYRGCNTPADADDLNGVTSRINTARQGLDERVMLTERAKLIIT